MKTIINVPLEKSYINCCDKCSCQYLYQKSDVFCHDTGIAGIWDYVSCPNCGATNHANVEWRDNHDRLSKLRS